MIISACVPFRDAANAIAIESLSFLQVSNAEERGAFKIRWPRRLLERIRSSVGDLKASFALGPTSWACAVGSANLPGAVW